MKNKKLKLSLIIIIILVASVFLSVLLINNYVKIHGGRKIITEEDAANLNFDCIIILGAGIRADGSPSPMLIDRLNKGIELYNLDISDRLLMSGDHGRKEYDEVNTMKQYAVNRNIPSGHIFMDHAGFSTYESMYRARDVFKAENIIVISQGYHLYRALYIAEKLGLNAYGIPADTINYAGQSYREFREIIARTKDFFKVILKPLPKYLGDTIPVFGDGDVTND